jgi:beta-glucosidase
VNRIRLSLSESENAAVRFGIAAHWRAFQPKRLRWLDQLATRLTDWVFNRQILDSAATGRIRSWFPGSPFLRERIRFAGPWKGLDFLGVNYYGRTVMSFSPKPPFVLAEEGTDGEKNDMGWEIYPSGLRDVLHETYRRYRVPVAVTENGLADRDDSRRGSFLTGHLEALAQARREGVPVEGYFHWSLTDNFEWAHGEAPRFGLVEVDYTTLERRPRPSFEVYRKFIADFGRGGPAPRGERA